VRPVMLAIVSVFDFINLDWLKDRFWPRH
jgi:hypothetical protein